MKQNTKLLSGIGLLIMTPIAYAVLTTVDVLEVRAPSETANIVSHGSSAIGKDNYASWWSQSLGSYNWAHNNSLASGYRNEAKNESGAIGFDNSVNYDATSHDIKASFASGRLNTILGRYSMAVGYNNDISADNASAIGEGIVITTHKANVVGEYNEDTVGADMRFVVGNGDDSSNRSNAFEVHKNGDVVITKPQGDIDMGAFGN